MLINQRYNSKAGDIEVEDEPVHNIETTSDGVVLVNGPSFVFAVSISTIWQL